MGIKRNDLAAGRTPCVECRGVGTVLEAHVVKCKNCKGRGWVLPEDADDQ